MNTTNGKIAMQSRKKLTNALFTIMWQYDFREITVTQITQEAKLSRKTFYRLYTSKEEILNDFFQNAFQEFITRIKLQEIHQYWDIVQLYFDFWEEKKELLALLKKNNLLYLLFEYTYSHSYEVFALVSSQEAMSSFQPLLPYMLAYSIGGMHSMMMTWAEKDMQISSSVLIESLKNSFQSPKI